MNTLNFFKKYKKIFLTVIITLIVVFCFCAWYRLLINNTLSTNRIEYELNTTPDGVIDTLLPGTVVDQYIEADYSYDSFSLCFSKGNVTDGCDVTVEFSDASSGKTLQVWEVSSDDLVDGGYVDFNLSDKMKSGSTYSVKIYSDNSSENNSVSLVTSSTYPQIVTAAFYPLGELLLNGEAQGVTHLLLKLNSSDNSACRTLYILFAVIFTLLIAFLCFCALTKKVKIETVFLVCCLSVGFIYMCLMTPNSVPDEPTHYFSAYKYSNAIMGKTSSNDTLLNMTGKDTKVLSYSIKPTQQTYNKVAENLFASSEDRTEKQVASVTAGNVLQYLPAAIGVTIGRMFNLNGLVTYYLGRLFNLAFFVIMTYFGMKKLPFGKMVLFVISLLPITLQQAASYSYDAVINGLAFFAIGYSLYLAYTKNKILVREVVALSIMCALLSASKAGVYLPIGALCFLVFAKRKSIATKKLVACIGAVLCSSVLLLLIFNIKKILNSLMPGTADTGVAATSEPSFYSVSFILTNTKDFIRMLIKTVHQMKDTYYTTMIGGQLGWLNISVGALIIALFFVMLFAASIKRDGEEVHFNFKSRTFMLLIAIGVTIEILMAALTWTDINSSVILGFQGRYLIPILPLAVYCLRNSSIVIKKNIDYKLALSVILLQGVTVVETFTSLISQ